MLSIFELDFPKAHSAGQRSNNPMSIPPSAKVAACVVSCVPWTCLCLHHTTHLHITLCVVAPRVISSSRTPARDARDARDGRTARLHVRNARECFRVIARTGRRDVCVLYLGHVRTHVKYRHNNIQMRAAQCLRRKLTPIRPARTRDAT